MLFAGEGVRSKPVKTGAPVPVSEYCGRSAGFNRLWAIYRRCRPPAREVAAVTGNVPSVVV